MRTILDRLASSTDPAERARLVVAFGKALDLRLHRLTDNVTATIGVIELNALDELKAVRIEMLAMRQAAIEHAQAEQEYQHNVYAKLHTLSNHVMSLEEKLHELSELLTSEFTSNEAPQQSNE